MNNSDRAGYLVVGGAILLRIGLLAWGAVQDATMAVKYTDVDYFVFSDAATLVAHGSSPYRRATYRYTPLLAWLLVPAAVWHPLLGKLLFAGADLLTGLLIRRLLILGSVGAKKTGGGSGSSNSSPAVWASAWSALWLLNPFVATISTRGNAESLVTALVMGCLVALAERRQLVAAILLGCAVHLKIYPLLYALPIWMSLVPGRVGPAAGAATTSGGGGAASRMLRRFFSWERVRFGFVSGSTFLALGGAMYHLYGEEFLEHTYLYHVTRQDHRHNFSLYFYHLYLDSVGHDGASKLLAFIPQIALVTLIGATASADLPFACFAQTFAFVMLNKVVTSQARWLYFAYRLEHLGEKTFRQLFVAGCVFAASNALVLVELARNHRGLGSQATKQD
ncbi:pentamidine resistance factor [Cladochytrium tenue]|nr:pentamidine resistance factor [Cladochytrium tenue]